ncbi:type IX secretion/gliding motility protein PorT/SprT [Arcticibacter eurypsychrophilus]|uniref:type IX secretion/gliding motility protein PorT/SprT n=1 Tax=Arcticibacter eurypsychrophilus TaxID=1434752 RepID=UPI00084DB313|nr:outer membrane beta-barrel protein [Arcticibacter eurypsychrophilus]
MKKSLLAIVIGLIISIKALAQDNWGGGVDDEVLHFGFAFQYVTTEFKVLKSDEWQYAEDPGTGPGNPSGGSLTSISSPAKTGFGLGLVTDLRLTDFSNLRFTPALVFADKELQYGYHSVVLVKKVQSTTVELPLGIKVKSERRKNFRAYMIAGGKYSRNIVSKKKLDDTDMIDQEKLVWMRSGYFSYEAGLGLDFYFEYFKMSPEIKFTQSFTSVLERRGNDFDRPVDRLYHKGIQISLFFE